MDNSFVWQLRVYWEDTDAGGVVYHSRYLNFFERARTEWLRSRGIDQAELSAEHNLVFAIRHMDIDFHKPARMDDRLQATVESISLGGSKMTMSQRLLHLDDDRELCTARVTAVCLDAQAFRPVRSPDWLKQRLQSQ